MTDNQKTLVAAAALAAAVGVYLEISYEQDSKTAKQRGGLAGVPSASASASTAASSHAPDRRLSRPP